MMLELCHRGELTPELVVRKMCHNPALLFGITDRGFVREGYKADLLWQVSRTVDCQQGEHPLQVRMVATGRNHFQKQRHNSICKRGTGI